MPREFGRNKRVSDLIQRELAGRMQRELEPARFGLVTVSTVNVSPDLSQALIYVTNIGGSLSSKELEHELNGMAGHFRHFLSTVLYLRSVPRLHFKYDASIERGSRLTALIDSLGKNEQ